jgi:hypothetical protein
MRWLQLLRWYWRMSWQARDTLDAMALTLASVEVTELDAATTYEVGTLLSTERGFEGGWFHPSEPGA